MINTNTQKDIMSEQYETQRLPVIDSLLQKQLIGEKVTQSSPFQHFRRMPQLFDQEQP